MTVSKTEINNIFSKTKFGNSSALQPQTLKTEPLPLPSRSLKNKSANQSPSKNAIDISTKTVLHSNERNNKHSNKTFKKTKGSNEHNNKEQSKVVTNIITDTTQHSNKTFKKAKDSNTHDNEHSNKVAKGSNTYDNEHSNKVAKDSNTHDNKDSNKIKIKTPVTMLNGEYSNDVTMSISSNDDSNEHDNKHSNDKIEYQIRSLTGYQSIIFNSLIDYFKEYSTNIAAPIKTSEYARKLDIKIGNFRTSINRLIFEKKLIQKDKNKTQKGKYTVYRIDPNIKKISLRLRKSDSNRDSNRDSNPIYSSNSNNINTTTINKDDDDDNWESINISPLEEHGFRQSHIIQLKKLNSTTPEIVQESINHMSFGLKNNKDTQRYPTPIKVLMGVLKKGDAWIEEKYVDPKEVSLQKILEHRKKKLEKKEK